MAGNTLTAGRICNEHYCTHAFNVLVTHQSPNNTSHPTTHMFTPVTTLLSILLLGNTIKA